MVYNCQYTTIKTGLGYAITAGKALQKVAVVLLPKDSDSAFLETWTWVLTFSALQVVLCQIPTMENLNWVSVIGAITSFLYSVIAMYYGIFYWGTYECVCVVITHTHHFTGTNPGTIGGAYTTTPAKIWSIFNVRSCHSYVHHHCNT